MADGHQLAKKLWKRSMHIIMLAKMHWSISYCRNAQIQNLIFGIGIAHLNEQELQLKVIFEHLKLSPVHIDCPEVKSTIDLWGNEKIKILNSSFYLK